MSKKSPASDVKKPWPKIWENKKTKKRFRVMPWWECVDPIVGSDNDNGAVDVGTEVSEGRKFRIGALVQIGWLMENEHKIWFGLGPGVEKFFSEVPSK